MSKEQLIQHIYDKLVVDFPSISENKKAEFQSISSLIDAFLNMYPAHPNDIAPDEKFGFDFLEIAIFSIRAFTEFHQNTSPSKTFNISEIVSRFLFGRLVMLASLRSTPTQEYPIEYLDTQNFTYAEHKSLLLKLPLVPVTSLSMIFPPEPEKNVMRLYVDSIHNKTKDQQLPHTLVKIKFFRLACNKKNAFLVEELLQNTEMLPKLRMTIELPEWDECATLSQETSSCIALYHELQNHIRDNQKTEAIRRSKGPLKSILSFSEIQAVIALGRAPELFVGDYRQFELMAPNNPDAWPCFDHYLATRNSAQQSHGAPVKADMDFNNCLDLLRTWALSNGMEQKCAAALFVNASTFTPANAKSLGQLFNSMDSKQIGQVGTQRWIQTVNTIWEEFGQEHFFAWKACMLDKSHHWLDCVEAKASIPISSPATPPSARKLTPTHFQISWLQLISTYSQQPQVINTHPELLRFVQTMLSPAQRLKMFGQNNRDLKAFFEKLHSASPLWLSFFQDPRLSPTAGLVPCAAWVCLLSDNKNGLQSLKWLPHFLILFQDISEADLFYFGLKTLYDCIKANAFDDQIIAALNASHDAVIAYQWFIQGRDPSIWLPVLYQEETQWSAEYFEILHYDQYSEAPECIVKSTLYAADLPEVKWMLSLGIIIAGSSKSQNSQFLSWATSVIQTKNHDKKINFIRALFQNQTGLGFYLDHSSLQHLWQLWCKNQLSQIEQLRYLAQITLDIQELKNQHDFQTYINDRSQRQPMLHALSQGFLSLGENLRQQCYLWFRASLHQITQWVDWGKIQLGHRSGIYHQAYQILTTLIKELQIATSQSTQPTHAKLPKPLQAHYTKLFSAQEQCYAGFFWSCNLSRINQARDLFKQLKEVHAVSKKAYYAQILDIIVQQQITIFTADQSYYLYAPNQKGHSRLHDICTELFLTVCHDCLCDPDLSETEKAFIQPLLRKQINQHVILLSQQIAHTPLAQKLNQWHGKQDGLQELNLHLSSSLKNCIPPKLQYLVRSLETMMTLPDQEKVLQCQDNRRLCLAT